MSYLAALRARIRARARRVAQRVQASPLAQRLVRSTFWAFTGTVGSRVSALILSFILARLLGVEGFGAFGVVQSTAGMFGVLAGLGMGVTTTKFVAQFRQQDPERAGRVIVLTMGVSVAASAIVTLAMVLVAPWLAEHLLAAPQLAGVLRVGSLLILLGGWSGIQTSALAGLEAFRRTTEISVLSGLLALPLMVGGVYVAGLSGAVYALVASQALTCVLQQRALAAESRQAGVPLALAGCTRDSASIWNFALPTLLAALLVMPVNWACTAIVVNGPGGYVEIGIYNAANQWFGALILIPTSIASALLPVLSERYGESDMATSKRILRLSVAANLVASFPLVVVGMLASPWIMAGYGPDFADHWPTLLIVLGTAALVAIQAPVGNLVAASSRMWTGLLMNMGWAAAFLTATHYSAHWGAMGLASSRLFAYALHATWTLLFAFQVSRSGRTGFPTEASRDARPTSDD